MPTWLLPTVVSVVVVAVAIFVSSRSSGSRDSVSVPSVAGLDAPVARSRLAQAGLLMKKGDVRLSGSVPRGYVLEQSPRPGSVVEPRTAVVVVLSAGSQESNVPDVVGMQLDEAEALLRSSGLTVRTDRVNSSEPTGTVLSSIPSPGQRVRTGELVRLTVSSGETTEGILVPFNLADTVFVLDPAPTPEGVSDAALEVARKLRALLGASGADVVVTRSVADTDTSPAARRDRASEPSVTAAVGLFIADTGAEGLAVETIAKGIVVEGPRGTEALAARAVEALRGAAPTFPRVQARPDAVLAQVNAPTVRVRLGSGASPDDRRTMADPRWADSVARALYLSLGDTYGRR